MPRQPIVSVLGHVDSGKTTLLDSIRDSRVAEGESGDITQMIGATEVTIDAVENRCGKLLESLDTELTVPGLLFIDTPGHAAFSSLRSRGGSIADIAILVVEMGEGVQPQTQEALEILQETGTPFVVALNKLDTLQGWRSERESFLASLKDQPEKARDALDGQIYELMAELNEHGPVADRFDRVDDFTEKVAVVPTSAETGEGIPELLMVLLGLSQSYLSDRLEVSAGNGRGTVMEVSEMEGMGKTADVIHFDGKISEDHMMVYGTSGGAESTEIRALLQPEPGEEIREVSEFRRVDEVEPASGVRIAGKEMDGIVSGSPVRTVPPREEDKAISEVEEEMEAASQETSSHGVVVRADSLGSLEALMDELEEMEVEVQRAEPGKVTKADVAAAEDEEAENRAIFAFNTSPTPQAASDIEGSGVELFQGDVIYELLDEYTEWKDQLTREKRERALEAIPRPAEVRVLEDHVFRTSDPAVVGVKVESGTLKPGSQLMNLEGERIGTAKSVQSDNESLDAASKGEEVAVSVSGATVGRDFETGEVLYVSLTGDDYRRLKDLQDLISEDEKVVMEEIAEIQDKRDPRWKL